MEKEITERVTVKTDKNGKKFEVVERLQPKHAGIWYNPDLSPRANRSARKRNG